MPALRLAPFFAVSCSSARLFTGLMAGLLAAAPLPLFPDSLGDAPVAVLPTVGQETTVAPEPTEAMRALVRDRLARSFAGRARVVLQRELVFLGVLRNSQSLLKIALALAPDNPHIWRLALDLAAVLEDGDPGAEAWLTEALTNLSRLEPEDEVLRLRRILDTVDKRQTAEARAAACQAMLTPAAVAKLGPRVAARVAFDLAMLMRRTGDVAAFEHNLLLALDLDPFFPEAAEVAAGYFRMSAPTVVDEVRALRGAALANPTRGSLALGLVQLCMEQGAYRSAASMLEVEVRLREARGPDEDYDGLLSDFVLALWGSDRTGLAFAHMKKRQEQLDQALLREVDAQGMLITMEERANAHLPPTPPLSTAVAAMSSATRDLALETAVSNAAFSFDTLIDQIAKRNGPPASAAELALQSAFVQLWLGENLPVVKKPEATPESVAPSTASAVPPTAGVSTPASQDPPALTLADKSLLKARAMITKAAAVAPLSDGARAKFDGWIALREKKAEVAKGLLAPLAVTDLTAKLGLALAHQELGETKDAARLLLELARESPSTAIGLWSRARLYAILGATPEIMPNAAAVEAAAEVPPGFVKLVRDGSASMLLRVSPRQLDARPWDPLLFDIELTNRSAWPLAVGPEGPIKDSTTITASLNVPGEMPRPPQIVMVSIDRSYLIEPGETLRVPVDLSITDASAALREDALSGAFISLHSIINWRTTSVGFEPSQLGLEVESPVVHVSGERVTRVWVERALTQLRDTTQVPDPEYIALLSGALLRHGVSPAMVPADAAELLVGSGATLAEAAKRLWPEARAWLVFATPKGKRLEGGDEAQELVNVAATGASEEVAAVPELAALDAVLSSDESPLVRIAWIAARTRRPEDAVLVASMESKDPAVLEFAQQCTAWMIEARDARAKQLNLKK